MKRIIKFCELYINPEHIDCFYETDRDLNLHIMGEKFKWEKYDPQYACSIDELIRLIKEVNNKG